MSAELDDLPQASDEWRTGGPLLLGTDTLRSEYHWRFERGERINYRGIEADQDDAPAFSWLGVAPR